MRSLSVYTTLHRKKQKKELATYLGGGGNGVKIIHLLTQVTESIAVVLLTVTGLFTQVTET